MHSFIRMVAIGVEGTLFATLMSIYNAAGLVSTELGASLTAYMHITDSDFTNLSQLILICSLSSLLPLPFLDRMFSYNKVIANDGDD